MGYFGNILRTKRSCCMTVINCTKDGEIITINEENIATQEMQETINSLWKEFKKISCKINIILL